MYFYQCASFFRSTCDQYNTRISQVAKDVRGGKDALVGVFELIESYFQRLEIHTEVPPTAEMMDTNIEIIVAILSILGIMTKGITQGRMSE